MAYEIYWIMGSPHAWRAMLGLEIKGASYDSKILQASIDEHKSPAFLQLNPRGQVPVLKDGEVSIYESIAILAYLDRKHPEPPLFGTTAMETGRVWQTVFEIENYVREPVFKIIRPIFSDTVKKNTGQINESVKTVIEEFQWLDEVLTESEYLTGKSISAADIALFTIVQTLLRALSLEPAASLDLGLLPFEDKYPKIDAWCARIERLPGYENTYPPNWRD